MNEDFRKTAPPPLATIPFEIPKPFETVLSNGLKIVLFEDKRLPLVSLRLCFLRGDADEPEDFIGISSAAASMLNEGTNLYSSKELAEKIEKLGANISAHSNNDFTIISASTLSLYLDEILNLIGEISQNPSFPEKELNLYKQNTIEGLKFQRSQPAFLANEQMARLLYGDHPYSIISPKASDVEKISRDVLVQFHRETYIPNNAMLIVVGDFEREDFLKEIENVFGNWKMGEVKEKKLEKPSVQAEKTLTIVDRPGSAQSNIVIGSLAAQRNNPDYFSTLVMNQILGAGASSRIFMNLREEKGYTYGAYSRFDFKRRSGEFEATAEVRTDVVGDSLKEFFYEFERIRNEKISDEELSDAKNYLTGVFPIRAETQEGLTSLIVSQKLYDLPKNYLQTYREKINEITIEDVENAAEKYVNPEAFAIVIVGDGSEVLEQAKAYSSNIEIFDTNGNAMDISNFSSDDGVPISNLEGEWILNLDFQGQEIPVSLVLSQDGQNLSGELETPFGKGEFKNGKIKGNKFNAAAETKIQNNDITLLISGTVEKEKLEGKITSHNFPIEISFTGMRKE